MRYRRAMIRVFDRLKTARAYERRHLAFLRTPEDHDLVCEIGYCQAKGEPITVKQIFLLGLGSVATVQRRLGRLRRLGVIHQRRCPRDRRSVEVTLSPKAVKVLAQYNELLGRAAGSNGERVVESRASARPSPARSSRSYA